MKPAYWSSTAGDRDRWMVSYADILTILLIFFIASAAQSLKSVQLKAAPPANRATPIIHKPQRELAVLEEQLQQAGLSAALEFRMDPRGLIINLPQTVLFAPGQDRISPVSLPVVGQLAGILRSVPNRVSLIGFADSNPIHNHRFRSNWELSASRSLQLLELLNTRFGIPEERLSIESYGALNPQTPNDTPEGRARNRRVEIVIWDQEPSRN